MSKTVTDKASYVVSSVSRLIHTACPYTDNTISLQSNLHPEFGNNADRVLEDSDMIDDSEELEAPAENGEILPLDSEQVRLNTLFKTVNAKSHFFYHR